jgi:hypothetical protein
VITNGLHSTVGQGLTRQLRQVIAVLKSFVIICSAQCEHPVCLLCTVCTDAPMIICYLVAYIYSLLIRLCCCIYTCICIAAVTLRICHRCRRAQSDFQLLKCNGRGCSRWFCNACCNVANTELPCSSSSDRTRAGTPMCIQRTCTIDRSALIYLSSYQAYSHIALCHLLVSFACSAELSSTPNT